MNLYIHIYAYMYILLYVHMNIYVYIYIHSHTPTDLPFQQIGGKNNETHSFIASYLIDSYLENDQICYESRLKLESSLFD